MISIATLIHAVIVIIVLGLVFGLLWFLIEYCAIPEPFNKVARVAIMIIAVLVLIGLLLGLAGYPIIAW